MTAIITATRVAGLMRSAVSVMADVRPRTPADRAVQLSNAALELCRTHAIDLDVSGAVPDGPCIIVANHVSYLDPVVLAALVPCAPIAKAEIASWPLIGPSARGLGVIFVRRGDAASGASALRSAAHVLREGVAVLNFPEGTTTTGKDVLGFRRGIFGLARLLDVPIMPAALRLEPRHLCWTGGAAFVPHYLWAASLPRIRDRVAFGDAIAPHTCAHASALAAFARERVVEQLRRIA